MSTYPSELSARRALALVTSAAALCGLVACGSDGEGSGQGQGQVEPQGRVDVASVARGYADGVLGAYDASIASATAMQRTVETFLEDPSQETLQAAREAWVAARDDYGPTEVFRFYNSPIDDAEDGPEGQINAWPMDEAYVDYVRRDEDAGIINNPGDVPEITAQALTEANEEGGETNVSTGWHAIEFLLWGQDFDPEAPGDRSFEDYARAGSADRRSAYLRVTMRQLIDDLRSVREEWAVDGGAYRQEFLADPAQALENIMRGVGTLNTAELAGERMAVAVETGDQEDEHSCFSDNTNADVMANIRGVRMVYRGELPGASGPGLEDLLRQRDPRLADALGRKIDDTLARAEGFPATFETMIRAEEGTPQKQAILDVITALEDQGAMMGQAAEALGVTVNFEL